MPTQIPAYHTPNVDRLFAPNPPITVLVVGADLDRFHVTRMVLMILGVRWVMYEDDSLQVAASAERIAPDAILIEDTPPRLDALDVVRRLRAHSAAARIPIIACVGAGTTGPRLRDLVAECDAHVAQPCQARDLGAAILACVSRHSRSRAAGADEAVLRLL